MGQIVRGCDLYNLYPVVYSSSNYQCLSYNNISANTYIVTDKTPVAPAETVTATTTGSTTTIGSYLGDKKFGLCSGYTINPNELYPLNVYGNTSYRSFSIPAGGRTELTVGMKVNSLYWNSANIVTDYSSGTLMWLAGLFTTSTGSSVDDALTYATYLFTLPKNGDSSTYISLYLSYTNKASTSVTAYLRVFIQSSLFISNVLTSIYPNGCTSGQLNLTWSTNTLITTSTAPPTGVSHQLVSLDKCISKQYKPTLQLTREQIPVGSIQPIFGTYIPTARTLTVKSTVYTPGNASSTLCETSGTTKGPSSTTAVAAATYSTPTKQYTQERTNINLTSGNVGTTISFPAMYYKAMNASTTAATRTLRVEVSAYTSTSPSVIRASSNSINQSLTNYSTANYNFTGATTSMTITLYNVPSTPNYTQTYYIKTKITGSIVEYYPSGGCCSSAVGEWEIDLDDI